MSTPIASLQHTTEVASEVIGAITPAQQDQPTPCPEWDVRQLVDHLRDSFARYTTAFDGDPEGADSFTSSARQLLRALSREGTLDRTVAVPVGEVPAMVAVQLAAVEAAVHGWDLAHATDQVTTFKDQLVAPLVPFTRQALAMVPADRSPFAPAQPAPDNAPAIDQLAALLGRQV